VLEDKFTVTRRVLDASHVLDGHILASLNLRHTSSKGYAASGDYSSHRSDAMRGDGMLTPNSTFATALLDPDLDDDGLPWTRHYDTASREAGLGVLFDLGINGNTNLLVGGRFDHSQASNIEYAGTLDLAAGTAADPAVFRAADERAGGSDSGVSWSVSVSHRLPYNVRPYVTVAQTSLALDENNNKYDNAVIEAGHIGRARLLEVGVKASLLDNKLFFAAAAYEQARRDTTADDDSAVLGAHVSSTVTQGWETELKWVPSPNLLLSFYALQQTTKFRPNSGANIMVDARTLGFRDVVDADGRVVYPAEAFLYGARSFLVLPPNMPAFETKQGNPETQIGLLAQYEFDSGLGFTLSGNYFSSVYAGRLQIVELPEAHVFNVGVFVDFNDWHIKCDLLNMFDERYFRARTGDTLADSLVSAMPGRRWQATFRRRF
jgi:hypothetical protein